MNFKILQTYGTYQVNINKDETTEHSKNENRN